MTIIKARAARAVAVTALACAAAAGQAAPVKIIVSVENLAPSTSVAVSPLSFGFGDGSFDGFDAGATATNGIPPIAELGDGTSWFAAFAAADPGAVLGTAPGPLTPGGNGATAVMVDGAVNAYFSFGAMVVPSNDSFIGNDDPKGFKLLDGAGNLLLNEITLTAGDVWDAGSETFDIANAAFIQGSNAAGHTDENGVVTKTFANFALFNGLTTAAGYTFDASLTSSTPIYRIRFSTAAVPEPSSWAMMIGGLALAGGAMRRRAAGPRLA